ncbi:MAG TPA: site-specific integrase, partial [Burkholderiales bacterium]|nr:site-specific integrase [Burkholderiales bacterium]
KKRNGRWQLRYVDEHRRMHKKSFRTKAEAEAFGRAATDNVERGLAPTFNRPFAELGEEWRRAHLAHGLRPSASKDYREALARLERFFGRRPLNSIHAADVEAFRDAELAALRARGVEGTRTVNKALSVLRQLFKFAMGRRAAAFNPTDGVKKIAKTVALADETPVESAVLTPGEILRLMAACDCPAAIAVLAFGGLRLGELLGLQWGDVEFGRGRLLVRRQLEAVTGELRAPKTRAGTRFVELPVEAMRELKRWKLRCPAGALDLVFPNGAGGAQDDRNFRQRTFYPALRRAGVRRVRVHDLRHTAASLMIATGADLAAVSRQLGHANPQITLSTYTHAFAKRDEAAGMGARMSALLRAETVGPVLVPSERPDGASEREVVELMVARGGIEPPTRGFSVLANLHPGTPPSRRPAAR